MPVLYLVYVQNSLCIFLVQLIQRSTNIFFVGLCLIPFMCYMDDPYSSFCMVLSGVLEICKVRLKQVTQCAFASHIKNNNN